MAVLVSLKMVIRVSVLLLPFLLILAISDFCLMNKARALNEKALEN